MQASLNKSAMLNGLIVGVLLSLKFLLGASNNTALSLLGFAISILIIVLLFLFSTKFRDKENEGFISYGGAFQHVFFTYVYGSILSSLVMLIYTMAIAPDYLGSMINEVFKMYDSINFPINESTYQMAESIFKPAPFALMNVLSSTFVAAFWGLILAAFIKKDKSIFE